MFSSIPPIRQVRPTLAEALCGETAGQRLLDTYMFILPSELSFLQRFLRPVPLTSSG